MAADAELDYVQITAPPGSEPQARGFYGALLGIRELETPKPLVLAGCLV